MKSSLNPPPGAGENQPAPPPSAAKPNFETSTLLLLGGGVLLAVVCSVALLQLDAEGGQSEPSIVALGQRSAYMLAVGAVLLWLVSIPTEDVSIVDLWWPANYVVQGWLSAAAVQGGVSNLSTRSVLLLALLSVWGVRLFVHLTLRKAVEGWVEDVRYPERVLSLRRGEASALAFHSLTLVQVFVMQGAWMWLIGQPLLVVFADDAAGGDLGPVDYVACALWLLGFVYEAGSDLQLQLFKKHRQPGQVCDTLFFKYTRHPNYFGDAVVWLSYYLFAAPRGEYGWLALGSPVLMFVLLRYVSGVVINDRVQAERKPHYREYIANTAPFCPWPWGPRLCRCGPPPAAETPIGSSKDEYDRLA